MIIGLLLPGFLRSPMFILKTPELSSGLTLSRCELQVFPEPKQAPGFSGHDELNMNQTPGDLELCCPTK